MRFGLVKLYKVEIKIVVALNESKKATPAFPLTGCLKNCNFVRNIFSVRIETKASHINLYLFPANV